MKIALDYDDTYTLDPEAWDIVIELFKLRGHEVKIVTAREAEVDIIPHKIGAEIVYCNGIAKEYFMRRVMKWPPDVWIDDNPETLLISLPRRKKSC